MNFTFVTDVGDLDLLADLGVAGLHRFVGPLASTLEWGADVIIVAAGMDGVLPGLVALTAGLNNATQHGP